MCVETGLYIHVHHPTRPRRSSSSTFFTFDRLGVSLSLFDGQDGVIGLAGPAHLNIAEAGLVEYVGVLGRRALLALRLHQHVEGEHLSHDGPSSVLKQQGLHQQDAAACQEDEHEQRHRAL